MCETSVLTRTPSLSLSCAAPSLKKKCALVSYKASVEEKWYTVVVSWQFVGTCGLHVDDFGFNSTAYRRCVETKMVEKRIGLGIYLST